MTLTLKDLHKIREREIGRVAAIWTRAFQQAAFYVWVLPDAHTRIELLHDFFEFRLCLGVLYGEVYTIADFKGGAYWMPSENVTRSEEKIIASGGKKFFEKLNATHPEALPKIMKYLAVVDPIHERLAPFPHLYLSSLAVDPQYQNSGHGSALIKAMVPLVDQEKMLIYLETNSEDNVAFYERFGFEERQHVIIPEAGLPVWVMTREPQNRKS